MVSLDHIWSLESDLVCFAQDCVTFGYDGQHVWCLPRGRRSMNSLTNVVDQTRQSQTYEYRYGSHELVSQKIIIIWPFGGSCQPNGNGGRL